MTNTPNSIASLNTAKRVLEEVTNTLIHKGYYAPPDYTNVPCGQILIPEPTLRKFARLTAKELKRPFVQVKWEHRWRSQVLGAQKCLIVEAPKRLYTAPLINPLMLVASTDPGSGIYWWKNCKSLWYFAIFDLDFANQYLSYFDTRDEFRAALKLPPKVSNITPFQEAA